VSIPTQPFRRTHIGHEQDILEGRPYNAAMHKGDNLDQELRVALAHLYDPSVLRTSSLVQLLGLAEEPLLVPAFLSVLQSAIETLQPGEDTPPTCPIQRYCEIIRMRFLEQETQENTARHLGLSVRHLRRQEKRAVRRLLTFSFTDTD